MFIKSPSKLFNVCLLFFWSYFNTISANAEQSLGEEILSSQKSLVQTKMASDELARKKWQYRQSLERMAMEIFRSAYNDLKAKGVQFADVSVYINALDSQARYRGSLGSYRINESIDSGRFVLAEYYLGQFPAFSPFGFDNLMTIIGEQKGKLVDDKGDIANQCQYQVFFKEGGPEWWGKNAGSWGCREFLNGSASEHLRESIKQFVLSAMKSKK